MPVCRQAMHEAPCLSAWALRSLPALEVIGSNSDLVAQATQVVRSVYRSSIAGAAGSQGLAVPGDAPSPRARTWTRRRVTQQGPQFARTEGLFVSCPAM